MTVSAGAYLCHYENITIYFCKDLIRSKKKCKPSRPPLTIPLLDIKCADVQYLFAPQYKPLSI